MQLHGEDGATAIEYGLLTAGIAAAILAVVMAVGGGAQDSLCDVSTKLGTMVTTQAAANC